MGGVGIISTVGIGLTGKQTNQGYKKRNIDAIRDEIRKARDLTPGCWVLTSCRCLQIFRIWSAPPLKRKSISSSPEPDFPWTCPLTWWKGAKPNWYPLFLPGRAASIIAQKWQQNYNYLPDAFVVEGPKAGGHLGFKADALEDIGNTLENLVDEVVKVAQEIKEKFNKEIPVIAAGGIFTGRDIMEIMKRGATGVQLGTRFVATEECDASEEFKQAVVDATDEDIQIIKSPVGMPGRSIFNRFLQEAADGQRRPAVCKHNCIRSCNPKDYALLHL